MPGPSTVRIAVDTYVLTAGLSAAMPRAEFDENAEAESAARLIAASRLEVTSTLFNATDREPNEQ